MLSPLNKLILFIFTTGAFLFALIFVAKPSQYYYTASGFDVSIRT